MYLRDKITNRLPLITILYCVLQPLLDVAGYWLNTAGYSGTVLALVRMSTLALMVLIGFSVSRRKRVYLIAGAGLLLYLAGHMLAVRNAGVSDLPAELVGQLRILILPALTLCLISFLNANEKTYSAIKLGFALNFGIILLVDLLATLTGTDPHTYSGKEIGVLGWFLWTSSQSAIVSILSPPVIAWSFRRFRGRLLPLALVTAASFAVQYFFASRLAFVTLATTGAGMALCIFLAGKQYWRQSLCVLLLAAVFCGLYPVSPMRENQEALRINAGIKQERIYATVAEYGVPSTAHSTDNPEALAAAYRYSLQGLVDRFGLPRVAAQYDNTLEQSEIFNPRLKKLRFNQMLMQDASVGNRLFGLELGLMQQQTEIYDFYRDEWDDGVEILEAENDFHGIYYACGAVGLGLMLLFLLYFGIRALIALLRSRRAVFSVDFAAFAAAYCYALVYAYTTASILRQTVASWYLCAILACLWHLSRTDSQRKGAEVQC